MLPATLDSIGRSGLLLAILATLLLVLIHGASACERSGTQANPAGWAEDAAPDSNQASPGQEAVQKLELGRWYSYPTVAADAEWRDEPLEPERWAQVSAELACAGRSNRGDPDSHRQKVRNILSHHRTTLSAVATWSTRLNLQEPGQADSWAQHISDAIKSCH